MSDETPQPVNCLCMVMIVGSGQPATLMTVKKLSGLLPYDVMEELSKDHPGFRRDWTAVLVEGLIEEAKP